MILAIVKGVWVLALRSLVAALWVVEHGVLAWRARRADEPLWRALLAPWVSAWRAGQRAAAVRWWALIAVYAVLALLR